MTGLPRFLLFGALAALLALAVAGPLLRLLPGPGDRTLSPVALPDHPLRIAALGTSLTARAAWPDRLQAALQACAPGATVQRFAKAGARSDWGLAEAEAVLAHAPDLVIVELVMNDADLTDGLMPWTSRSTHRALLARLAAVSPAAVGPAPRVILLTVNPVRGWRSVTRPFLPLYQRAYGPLADESGAGLVDGLSLWQARGVDAAEVPDGVHPDPQVEAQVLEPALVAAVAQAYGVTCSPG